MKKQFKTVYPLYGAKLEKRNKNGQFIIMRQDWIDRPILNPETLTGKLLWYTTENGYDYCHPYKKAKNRADIIVSALNKTNEQIALENLSLDMLEVLRDFIENHKTISRFENGSNLITVPENTLFKLQTLYSTAKKAAGFTD
jgi:hypothetical protein